jgi:hypothetical protein
MSSDVVGVAIAGGVATVSVALIGGLSNVFGATWRESRAQGRERVARENDIRYERARELADAAFSRSVGNISSGLKLAHARTAFGAVLRPGEQPVADFIARELSRIMRTQTTDLVLSPVDVFAEDLFSYLRGDLSLADITTRRPADGGKTIFIET